MRSRASNTGDPVVSMGDDDVESDEEIGRSKYDDARTDSSDQTSACCHRQYVSVYCCSIVGPAGLPNADVV